MPNWHFWKEVAYRNDTVTLGTSWLLRASFCQWCYAAIFQADLCIWSLKSHSAILKSCHLNTVVHFSLTRCYNSSKSDFANEFNADDIDRWVSIVWETHGLLLLHSILLGFRLNGCANVCNWLIWYTYCYLFSLAQCRLHESTKLN